MSEAGLVQRTIWILRAVAANPEGMGLSEVARAAEIPKATCYRVLSVLERERWLDLDPVTKRYRVSFGLLSIVGGLLDQGGAHTQMQAILRDLAERTQETSGLDVLMPPHVMVVSQVTGPKVIGQTYRPVPRTLSVWRTSTGKALLSSLTPEQVRADFGDDFAENRPAHLPDLGVFLEELAEVRERGYAVAYDEMEEGAAAVAATVRTRHTEPYAVWIGGPTFRITRERIPEIAAHVREAAGQLERVLEVTGAVIHR
ncbi:IclR family transcriptional regulator [Salinactinospora qingdaonensis]|uniref:IclR family transcriptional regulator n=1 Tax=Salinactinospora qingdaonensis TaxID=702744 RepID=A0ABP7F6W5_9ACTN